MTFWHTVNSFGVLFLIMLLSAIGFGIYRLQKSYKLEILRGSSKTKIQVFRKDNLPNTENPLNTVEGIYRKKTSNKTTKDLKVEPVE